MKTYSLQQIKKYLESESSVGYLRAHCTEENIDKANLPYEESKVLYKGELVTKEQWKQMTNNS